jgi:UDP-N-acetylglucosamine--N-acetylmuramyl-(pentapeptide) pyrophosphoryl-undecaprenol N-acetylglucosamine transferase
MKIILTGGGTGGHFYPLIAVSEEINKLSEQDHLLESEIYLLAPDPYDDKLLFENGIKFVKTPAGKMRRYFSILNIIDLFKTSIGIINAMWIVYKIFPDVIFAKGGYVSFPVLLAGRIFGIPIIIHESDSVPGRANIWAGKFAKRIAVSYMNAAKYFPDGKVAFTGNPIRREILIPQKNGAYEFLKLNSTIPTILVLGGSQGAKNINDAILDILPTVLEKYQIIHQTGEKNFEEIVRLSSSMLKDSEFKDRYIAYPYLNDLAQKMSAGISKLVISRAGSAIFEIANWGIPSIIIPIADSNGDHQRKNAFIYAESGACIVIEEENLSTNLILSELDRLMGDKKRLEEMSKSAKAFSRTDAAEKIANEILKIGLNH